MNIQDYIESGVLETYVLGSASETEARQLLSYKDQYPEVKTALEELELDMEFMAGHMSVKPPPALWHKINHEIDDLIVTPERETLKLVPNREDYRREQQRDTDENRFIEVEYESSHMRVHKNWKWVFAAVFVLGKIFLATAIYFYLENRQAQEQIKELKTELKQVK